MLQKTGRFLFFTGVFVLTLIPILNIVRMINYGENNLSNDYILVVPVIAKALEGQLGFWEFINESWVRAHFFPVTMVIHIISAYFFHWNTYLDMYFGVALMLLRLLLLWDMYTKWQNGILRYLALPFLSAFVFSASQASTYTWGATAEAYGLLLLFGTLGLWGLIHYRESSVGLGIMVISGILCSWTQGAGVLIWPLYFIALFFLEYRKIQTLLIWALGAFFSAVPYFYFMIKFRFRDQSTGMGLDFLNLKTVIRLLGAALTEVKFVNESPLFFGIGLFGIFILVVLALIWRRKYSRDLLRQSVPAFVMILWGVLGAWQISIGRTDMAPWYTSISMNFWLGLIGLMFVLFFNFQKSKNEGRLKNTDNFEISLTLFAFTMISIIYLKYNVFTPAFPFFLPSRAPSSAACIRQYKVAPTYCEGFIHLGVGKLGKVVAMAIPLEKHQLSVFAPDQTWTLQGDYIFEEVKLINPLFLDISWWSGLNGKRSEWRDYRHLDLMLPAPSAITWPLDFTDHIDRAVLETAIGINAQYAGSKIGEGVTFKIEVLSGDQKPQTIYQQILMPDASGWQKIKIDLKQYLGQKITLQFSTIGAADEAGAWAMFRYPSIFVHQSQPAKEVAYQPQNARPPIDFQQIGSSDFLLSASDPNIWQATHLTKSIGTNIWFSEPGAVFQLKTPANICLANYSEFVFDITQTEEVEHPYITVQLWINTGYQVVNIPILKDAYAYPLKLLDLDPYSYLQDIRILPNDTEGGQIQFNGVKLVASNEASSEHCANYYPAAFLSPETIVGEITAQNVVSQTFISQCEGAIDSVDLFTATYGRENQYPLIFTLTEVSIGRTLSNQIVSPASILNNDWVSIPLSPMLDSYQKEYMLTLESPDSISGNAVTVYQSLSDQYALGELYINQVPLSSGGDLVFRYHCSVLK
ncbi:MAG: hypothetical protein IPN96_22530 [Anaerolineales bacterium]|nr:hypothetical protein [Anaerolineales bacterium]